MATSHYFNNYNSNAEQRVIEDLIVESIKIMGFDAYYVPNTNDISRDTLFGEDPVKNFKSAYAIEFYLSNSLEYMGEKEFFSKFGLEIKNNVNVVLSKRSFNQRIPPNTLPRPLEGDLIYVPFLNGTGELYEIKFVNQTKDFFMLGRSVPYFYELELEKYKFSQESIATGVAQIDQVMHQSAYTLLLNMNAGNGYWYTHGEIVYQSPDTTYANASVVAMSKLWNPTSNVLSVHSIVGEFKANVDVYGASSGAVYKPVNFDTLEDDTENETYDNKYIDNQANNIIDLSEINPFGKL